MDWRRKKKQVIINTVASLNRQYIVDQAIAVSTVAVQQRHYQNNRKTFERRRQKTIEKKKTNKHNVSIWSTQKLLLLLILCFYRLSQWNGRRLKLLHANSEYVIRTKRLMHAIRSKRLIAAYFFFFVCRCSDEEKKCWCELCVCWGPFFIESSAFWASIESKNST